MDVPEATVNDYAAKDLLSLSKYSFKELAKTIKVDDNSEKLVAVATNKLSRVVCAPFWEDPGDLEGQSYASYIAEHSDFVIQARAEVVNRIFQAAALLPKEWTLLIKAGYRPPSVQQALLKALIDETKSQHPDWSPEAALAHARKFVADPALKIPPHSTGAAIDVDIVDQKGQRVDMGCPPNTDSEVSYTHSDLITPEQQRNRRLLLAAFLGAGFANLAYEWWHFSYGDQYWAAFYNKPAALYNVVVDETT